ncbi:conserved hypothetical protein [Candidatus Defluviicoccus seviourii]|uniref:Uncharacterized protein n=2 Tax=root TaxID=1 RepID=A0A564WK28_9PROT|nr:conserved hypothetical protein [uncultured Defluviicoccus sp.]VUX48024.1 conserved hypothetical protein [Candidatus Defluviicoccus seviourii]
MQSDPREYTLEFLLDFDGRVHWLESGHCLKFKIRRVDYSAHRPHGLRYSFTLHDPKGRRLIGFDNAHHPSQRRGMAIAKHTAMDHWHRTRSEAGRPYAFKDAETLLADFFREVRRVLAEAGVSDDVVKVEER